MKFAFTGLSIVFSLFFQVTPAQSTSDSSSAHTAVAKGDSLFHEARAYEDAAAKFDLGKQLFQQSGHGGRAAYCQLMEGRCIYSMGRVQEADAAFREGIAMAKAAGEAAVEAECWYYRGRMEQRFGEAETALAYMDSCLQAGLGSVGKETHVDALAMLGKGEIHLYGSSELKKAYDWMKRAKEVEEGTKEPDKYTISRILLQMANVLDEWRDFGQVIRMQEEALAIRTELYGPMHHRTGNVHLGLGASYFGMEEYAKAHVHFQKALAINLVSPGNREDFTGSIYNNLAMTSHYQGELALAQAYLDTAFQIKVRLHGPDSPALLPLYYNSGLFLLESGQASASLAPKLKALSICDAQFPPKHPETATAELEIGHSYLGMEEYEKALAHFHQGMARLVPGQVGSDPSIPPIFEAVESEYLFLDALFLKGSTFLKLHEARGQEKDLLSAHAHMAVASGFLEGMRTGFSSQASQLYYSGQVRRSMQVAVAACAKLWEATGERRYLEEAFRYAEQSRGNLLMEGLQAAVARETVGLPDSLLLREAELEARMAAASGAIREEVEKGEGGDVEKLNAARKERGRVNEAHSELVAQIKAVAPAYHQVRYALDLATIDKVQAQLLDSASAFVEYFFGEEDLFIFHITPDSAFLRSIPLKNGFPQLLDSLLSQFTQPSLGSDWSDRQRAYASQAYRLRHILLGDFPLPPHLTIVPDQKLAFLPFESLLSQPALNASFRSFPYLLRDHAIGYAFSASHLLGISQSSSEAAPHRCLAFAWSEADAAPNPPDNRALHSQLSPLPGSALELQQLSRHVNGDFRFGKEASKAAFLSTAPRYGLLHLAVHGMGNAADPLDNRLLFPTAGSGSSASDLRLWEVYGLDLNAEMVVLSACETGAGSFEEGEGVMNLARGFAYAGSRSQVMSLWLVDDLVTAELMEGFYAGLSEGMSRREALRQAKLRYLEGAAETGAHPYYWAACLLVGKGGGLEMAPPPRKWPVWLLGSLLAALALGLWLVLQRRRKLAQLALFVLGLSFAGSGCGTDSPSESMMPKSPVDLVSVAYPERIGPQGEFMSLYSHREKAFVDAPEWVVGRNGVGEPAMGLFRIGEKVVVEAEFFSEEDVGEVRIEVKGSQRAWKSSAVVKFVPEGDGFRGKGSFCFPHVVESLGIRDLEFEWEEENGIVGQSSHQLFFIYDWPKPPMNHPVWVELLEAGCILAKGKVDMQAIAEAVMQGFIAHGRNFYRLASEYTGIGKIADGPRFHRVFLERYIDDIFNARNIRVDCYAGSHLLICLLKVLGVEIEMGRIAPSCTICSSPLRLVGPLASRIECDEPFELSACRWSEHVFPIFGGDSFVFDPVLSLDTNEIQVGPLICTHQVHGFSKSVYKQHLSCPICHNHRRCCLGDSIFIEKVYEEAFVQALPFDPPKYINKKYLVDGRSFELQSSSIGWPFSGINFQFSESGEQLDLALVPVDSEFSPSQIMQQFAANTTAALDSVWIKFFRFDKNFDSLLVLRGPNCVQELRIFETWKFVFMLSLENSEIPDTTFLMLTDSIFQDFVAPTPPPPITPYKVVWEMEDSFQVGRRYHINAHVADVPRDSILRLGISSDNGNVVLGAGDSLWFHPINTGLVRFQADIRIPDRGHFRTVIGDTSRIIDSR